MNKRTKEGHTIKCPECGSGMVYNIDTRASTCFDYPSVRHRKVCVDCHHRWTTQEVHVDALAATEKKLLKAESA